MLSRINGIVIFGHHLRGNEIGKNDDLDDEMQIYVYKLLRGTTDWRGPTKEQAYDKVDL